MLFWGQQSSAQRACCTLKPISIGQEDYIVSYISDTYDAIGIEIQMNNLEITFCLVEFDLLLLNLL